MHTSTLNFKRITQKCYQKHGEKITTTKKNIFWTIPILKKDLKNNNEESQKYLEWLCGKKLASQPHSSRFSPCGTMGKCLPLELMDKASGFGQQKPRSPTYVLNKYC